MYAHSPCVHIRTRGLSAIPTDLEKKVMAKKKEGMPALARLISMLETYGMRSTFIFILAIAQSKRHLRYIHDSLLPAECRLLRSDVQELLEPAWEHLHPGSTSGATRTDDETIQFLIEKERSLSTGGKAHMLAYYMAKLNHGRECLVRRFIDSWQYNTIYSQTEGERNGSYPFLVGVCGHGFDLGLGLTPDSKHMLVLLRTRPRYLTEPLTRRFLNELPPSRTFNSSNATLYDQFAELDFCWLTTAEGLAEHLRTEREDRSEILIGDKRSFLAAVAKRLQSMGIPITQPITLRSHK
ncbi:MAG: hypothetical protein Q7S48_00565 [bacterium]|nr:hypothetical protein [bacterium]